MSPVSYITASMSTPCVCVCTVDFTERKHGLENEDFAFETVVVNHCKKI